MIVKNYFKPENEQGLALAMDVERRQIAGSGKIACLGCKGWGKLEQGRQMSPIRSAALDCIKGLPGKWIKTAHIAEKIGVSTSVTSAVLSGLSRGGYIDTQILITKGVRYRLWCYMGRPNEQG